MIQTLVDGFLQASAWVRYGRKHDAPVRPDRIIRLDPDEIERKPAKSPETDRVHPTLVVGGDWDQNLSPITEDIVYRAFHRRFVEGEPWENTGYIQFLTTDISEHGDITAAEAKSRCRMLDKLYKFIDENGYKTQHELAKDGGLIDGLTPSTVRPPAYREVSVDVTRDGEFVWHGGMHRLVITKLLDVDTIPVRINIRHDQWQARRDSVVTGECSDAYSEHPDIEYLHPE